MINKFYSFLQRTSIEFVTLTFVCHLLICACFICICAIYTWSPEFLTPIMHTCNGVLPSLSVTVAEAAEMGRIISMNKNMNEVQILLKAA